MNSPPVSQPNVSPPATTSPSSSPPGLLADKSFWGLTITQFLGAFNDNLYKQLMLLIAIPAVGAAINADVQGWATALFSLPFVLLSGFAGFLADKFSKSKIIFLCKVAEIGITILAVIAFLQYSSLGDVGTWSVLFLMGVHSTFFGPGKYGILPELFAEKDLPRANGLILMSTFLAIILGVVTAGALKDALVVIRPDGTPDYSHLWIGSLVCAGIAVVGTLTSLMIRRTSPAQPSNKFSWDDAGISRPVRQLLWEDKSLLLAVIISSLFYVIAGVVMPTVNLLGKNQILLETDLQTSVLTGGLAIGIILGAISANLVFKHVMPTKQVLVGTLGMFFSLVALGVWKAGGAHLLGFWGSLMGLILTGMFAAVFIIPIQVFMQKRPSKEIKGRMIGTMNFANFVGVLIAGPLYQGFLAVAGSLGWPPSSIFWMLAVLLVPVVLFFRLPTESHASHS